MSHFYGYRRSPEDIRDKIADPAGLSILPEVDLRTGPMPRVFDQGHLGSCHDDETEVLTEVGWKLFSDLDEYDRLATVDPETRELSYEFPTRVIRMPYSGDMVCCDHQFLNFKVTPDHKMLVRRWNERDRTLNENYEFVDAGKLGWYSGLMNRVAWSGENPSDIYVLPGVAHKRKNQRVDREIAMATWLRFLGIYMAEGTMIKRFQVPGSESYKIQIAASKPREKTFVREVLDELGVTALELTDRFTFSNKQIYEALASLGLEGVKAGKKFVPAFVFDQSATMIREFLSGHFEGDGCLAGNRAHYTSSARLATDLQRLIFLSGEASRISIRNRVGVAGGTIRGRDIVPTLPEHRVSVNERRNLSIERRDQIATAHYDGDVFCAEMSTHHTLVTRRDDTILISGNCTSNAVAACLQFDLSLDRIALGQTNARRQSRLDIYYGERSLEGSLGEDDPGAYGRDGFKFAQQTGALLESRWPYDITTYQGPPPTGYKRHKLAKPYAAVQQDVDHLKAVLSNNQTVAFGFTVYSSFESPEVAANGIVPMPAVGETELGGHEVVVVGYLAAYPNHALCRNSWGTGWAISGYFLMPWAYLTDSDLTGDLRTIVRAV